MPVVELSLRDAIDRLSTYVRRMEQRYECKSPVMAAAVEERMVKETAEIARWLISYRTLLRLQAEQGAGTDTRATAKSTRRVTRISASGA